MSVTNELLSSMWPVDLHFPTVGKTVAQVQVNQTLIRDAGFIGQQDRPGIGVFLGDDLLSSVSEPGLIPLDVFEKPLESSRRPSDFDGHGVGGFAMTPGQLSGDVIVQELSSRATGQAGSKPLQG